MLLQLHNDSLFEVLSSIYPQYEWMQWRFKHCKCPQNFWNNIENQRKYIEWAGKELNIKEMSDWYKISNEVKKKIKKKMCLFQGFEESW